MFISQAVAYDNNYNLQCTIYACHLDAWLISSCLLLYRGSGSSDIRVPHILYALRLMHRSVTGEIAIISVKITMWHHLPRLVCASRYTASVCNENLIVWDIDICRRWRSRDYSIYSRYIDDLVLQWGRNWYLSRFNTTNEKIIVSRRNTRNLIIATKCDDNDKMRNHLYRDIDATLQFKISLRWLTIIFLFHHVSTSRLWKFNHKKYSIPIIWYINNIR